MPLLLNPVRTYPKVVGVAFLLLLAVVGSITVNGFFPIAMVNGHWITSRQLDRMTQIAERYYEALSVTYEDFPLEQIPSGEKLQAEVLLSMIEEYLIKEGVKEKVGTELESRVVSGLKKELQNEELLTAGQTLYELDKEDFIRYILTPRVEADILGQQLALSSQNLDDWIEQEKKAATVRIFSPYYAWDGVEVRSK